MRDINKYTEEYVKSDFEEYLVAYRRKKVLEVLNMVSHRRILKLVVEWNHYLSIFLRNNLKSIR